MHDSTEFRQAKVAQLSRKLNAHLNQRARNKVTEATHQLRAASRVIDLAMQQGTLDVQAISSLLMGMVGLVQTTKREFLADIAEDNRVTEGA